MSTTNFIVLALTVAGVYCLHRLAVWAEDRGWIYYRKGHGRSASAMSAAQELQSILQPSAKHVADARRYEELHREASETAGNGPGAESKTQ